MIIICEKCSSKFNVPDSAIGENGRKVKCTSCSHTWHQMPEQGDSASNSETKQPANTPAENGKEETAKSTQEAPPAEANSEPKTTPHKKPKRFVAPTVPLYQKNFVYYGSAIAAGFAFLTLIAFTLVLYRESITHVIPGAQKAYDMVALYDNHGLKLELVDCTISEIQSSKSDNDTIEIEVEVSVLNTADKDQSLTDIRFTVYDIERNYVGELIMPIGLSIEAQKNTIVEGRLNRVPKDSFYVAVDFGNEIDIKILNPDKMHNLG